MYMIRHCKKQMMWVVIIAAVIMMMMAAALDKAPVCLGDLRPELVQSSCTAVELQWGGLSVKIDDSAQIEQIQQLAVDLKVKKTGKNRRNEIMYEDMTYQVPVMNGIHFFIDTEVVESISLSGDFTEIAPKDNDREDCAYLQVQEPEQLQALFLTQGQNLLAQQKDTAFTADLDNDGVPEQIVVNMNPWSENAAAELSIYRSDGAVLDWQTFASAHAGWGSCYLYQQEGRDYICTIIHHGAVMPIISGSWCSLMPPVSRLWCGKIRWLLQSIRSSISLMSRRFMRICRKLMECCRMPY